MVSSSTTHDIAPQQVTAQWVIEKQLKSHLKRRQSAGYEMCYDNLLF